MLSTGLWRGELARRFPESNGIRYFIPPVMVLGVTVGVLLGIGGLVQALLGATPWLLVGLLAPAVYAALRHRRDARQLHGARITRALWFLLVLPCIHFSWGIGFVLGYLTLTSNITAHNGR